MSAIHFKIEMGEIEVTLNTFHHRPYCLKYLYLGRRKFEKDKRKHQLGILDIQPIRVLL